MVSLKKFEEYITSEFQVDAQAHIGMQADYLKDYAVMYYFKDLIELNKHLFRGKVVLNLACGVGILAIFAIKAGARCVFAVDDAKTIDFAEQIIANNKMDHVIHLKKGRLEDVKLPVNKVDIILCDWIGYSLLFQSHCADVIYARDRWLKEDGLVIPDVAHVYIKGFEDAVTRGDRIDYWSGVYGFNMKAIQKIVLKEPVIRKLKPKNVLTTGYLVKKLDLNVATYKDLEIRSCFLIKSISTGMLDGIFCYFVLEFSKSHTEMKLNTGAHHEVTRWMQTLFFLEKAFSVNIGDHFSGTIEIKPFDRNKRNSKKVTVRTDIFRGSERKNLIAKTGWTFQSNDYVENEDEDKEEIPLSNKPNGKKKKSKRNKKGKKGLPQGVPVPPPNGPERALTTEAKDLGNDNIPSSSEPINPIEALKYIPDEVKAVAKQQLDAIARMCNATERFKLISDSLSKTLPKNFQADTTTKESVVASKSNARKSSKKQRKA